MTPTQWLVAGVVFLVGLYLCIVGAVMMVVVAVSAYRLGRDRERDTWYDALGWKRFG